MAQNNFLQSPFDALATATEESIYSLPPLPGQKSSTPTQVSEVPRDTRAPAVEQPEEPVAGQPVKAMPGQYLPPAQLRPVFEAAAREFNVPVNVLMSLAYQESTYNPAAIGQPTKYGRAKGIMQYIDSTANGLGINPFDPNQAVPAAARQLRERLDKGYSFQDAIRAHHGGDNRKQWGPITEDYVQKVWGRAGQIGEELGAGSPPAAAADPLAEMNKAEPGRYRVATPEEVAAFEKKQAAMTEAEQAKEAEAQKELGVLDTTAMLGKQLWDAAAYHLPGSIAAAMEGDDPFAEKDWKDKLIERSRNRARESTKLGDDKRQTAIPGISAQDIKSLGPSLGFSVTGMGAGFGVGVPATAAGTLVAPGVGTGAGIVAGGTASGVTAYRMATNSFVRDLRELADLDAKKQGKPPLSDAEFAEKMKGIQGAVTEYGLWEALPEAASNVVGFGVLKAPVKSAIGKYFGKNVLTRLGTKAAAVYGSELSTETVTQQGQNNVMADVGQQFGLKGENEVNRRSWTSAADLGESFSEIAPTTILQTTLLAGGTKSAMILSDRIKRGNLSREQYDALMELNDLVERGQFDPEGARLEAVRRLDPNNAQLAEVPQANQGPATDGIVIPPAGGRDRDEAEKARRAASGPLTRSVERVADDAATEKRVTVAGPQGQITGFVESYQEDGQGGFVARVLGDDGQVYTFTSADGVSITPLAPEPVGPLTAAVEQVAAAQPDVAPSIPAGPALWKNSEFDVPVRVIGVEQQAGADGRFYARVEQNGVESFIPADEIAPAPVAQPVADAGDQQPAEPVSQPATSVAVTEEGAGVSQPPQAAPDFADLFDEQGRPKFPNAQTVRDFKKRTGLGQDGVRAIQAAIQEGRQITLEEAMQADKDARAERAAALEQDKKDSEAEAEKAKANAASPAKKREVVGEFEIPGLEGATNRVRVFRQGSRVDAVGLDEGTANNDLTALIAYGMTVEQALAQFYGDHAQGATPDASKVNRVDGRQDQTASKPLAEMDEPALRERLKYIASQGKANGWNKLLTNARREVEAEINKRTEGAKTDERADSVGVRVPDVSEGSVQADAPRGTDQPAGREGDAQLRDGVQADSGPAVPADGNAVPAAGAAADRQPALTPKRAAALDRIAKGTAFFGTPEKADAFIAKNEIGDTHEVVQTGKVRFEVKPKTIETQVQDFIDGKRPTPPDLPAPIPAGGTVTKDEPPEENKPAAEQAPAPVEPLISAPEEKKSAEQAWSESSPADRRKMLADAGYTDGDQARVLSGTDWADLSDVVRGKIQSPARKPISVTKAGSGATAIVIDPSAMSGREPDLIKQLRENGSVQAEQIEQAKTELAAGDDSLAKDLLRINAPAVNQEPIKNEPRANAGPTAETAPADQEPVKNLADDFTSDGNGLSLAAKRLREISTGKPSSDADVGLNTQGGVKYVSFGDAVAAARRAIESGIKPVPFQIHGALDILIGDAQRVIDAAVGNAYTPESQNSPKEAPAQRPAPAPAPNTIFTEDAATKARELLRRKLGQLNSGLDPEMLQAGITLAGYHIEKGARTFSAYAKAMIEDLGDVVKPYLKSWYMGVKYDPRAAGFDGMSDAAEVEGADIDALLKPASIAPQPSGNLMNALYQAISAGNMPSDNNAPAVNQEPIKNETPAQQGSETAEQTSDQEKFSANRVERAGGFFMDLKDVAKNGDNTQSPWLLSDGRIVGTGQDHISFADQYLPGGAAGYSDFMKETGAVRASFFNDADRGYVATLHVAKGQNLTPEQLGALKFIESQRGAPMVVLLGAADGLVNPEYTETTVSALASDQETAPASGSLVDSLYGQVSSGNMPSDNNALRKMVAEIDGAPADNTRLKAAQEALEAAMVRLARDIVAEGKSIRDTYDKLVALYASQPNLNIRTSTSIENQAYSTPAPLAYLSAKLAGIDGKTKVYEPTAGNGMLLITADPKNATANELEDTRFANLKSLGFDAMQGDAMEAISSGAVVPGSQDAVITNPPFGSVKDDAGKATKVSVDGYKIGKIDHLIAAEALKAMKDNGKATLIIGADKVAGGIGTDDRIFFNWLYGNYDVTSHFEADGKLYARQGANWPVRVITINGRKKSSAVSPRPGDVKRVSTWEEVYEQYQQGLDAQISNDGGAAVSPGGAVQRGRADDAGASPVAAGAEDRADGAAKPAARARSDGNVAGERAGTVRTGAAGAAERTAGDTGAQRRDEPAAVPDRLEEGSAKDRSSGGKARADRPAGDAGADRVGNEFQTTYVPRSSNKDEGILIPVNMAQPTQDALNALEDEVGDIDEYVMRELGYPSKKALHDALMGLQVDSVAAAIFQISRGKGIIISDMTGVGKGRQAAAIIRWATRKGHTPVFVTVKPSLFTDMFNDLADIGTDDVAPLLLNADEWIANAAGEKLFTNKKSAHRKVIADIAATGELPQGRNALFLTYSQINTENAQRSALSALAPRAVFILDESHNAGGASQTGEFVRTILGEAVGVTYLSATYAKRPDNMPVYFKTDIGMAISDDGQLTGAIAAGGLPLQTVVSHNLVKAGQMFRRERSYDGVSITTTADTARREEHEKLSDTVTLALRGIVEADREFHNGFVEQMAQQLAEEGAALMDIAGNQASQSVNHTEFSSVVHNFVRQMLLGLKADSAADKAIEALKAGQKPLIAVENTMGSFLAEYAANSNIRQGQPLGRFDYRTVLERALERSRVIVIKDATGNDTKRKVELSELDPVTRDAYDRAQAIIRSLDLDIPVSPIDWMRNRIEQAGYTVAEITGRNLTVDYSEGAPKLSQLPTEEQNDKVGTTRKFNDGRLDAIILNVSGSTGISLHASEKFKDKRPRKMIVAQAAQDINIFMQMLGRIHRTGQVTLPSYEILSVDLPAEKRPTSILSNKMKSLNANTSSNTESATSIKSSDLLNKYGDRVVGAYLADNMELSQALGINEPTDLARKATGRLALMPVEVQKAFYAEVEERYSNLIDYLNKTNQNELEPRTFDYDAKETAAQVIFEGDNPSSPFGADAIYHEYSIKAQGKPMTPDEIRAEIVESLGGKTGEAHAQALIADLMAEGIRSRHEERLESARRNGPVNYPTRDGFAFMDEGQMLADPMDESRYMRDQGEVVAPGRNFIASHPIGSAWRIEINGDVYNAVVTNIRSTHKGAGNPFSMSKIQVTVALNGALRSVTVPATQFEGIEVAGLGAAPRIDGMFEQTPQDERQMAKIITGNLLAAYGEISTKGTIINFTKADGTTEQGILLPKVFNPAINTRGDYRMRSVADVLKFLRESEDTNIARFGVSNREGTVRVVPDGAGVALVVPKSKAKGGKFFLNKKLTDITGDFVSQGQTMRVEIPASKAADAVAVVMDMNALYALPSMAAEAKKIIGEGAGETRYSVAGSAGFFSALAQFVENAEAKSATADGWMQQIRGQVAKGNVKADEVAWTGVEEWLGTQTGKVPREAVTEFLRANGVQVRQTTLGVRPDFASMTDQELREQYVMARGFNPLDTYGDPMGRDEILYALEGMSTSEVAGTKYAQYTLPGGENYREVLLTLPVKTSADPARAEYEAWAQRNGLTPNATMTEQRYERETGRQAPPPRTMTAMESDRAKNYKSSHWDDPNVLAHIRVNDRTDADGKRVLFVEEIQSDWGQDGKKKGFANPNSPVYAVFAKSGAFLKSFEDKADADAFAETVSGDVRAEKRQPGDDSRPPSAPFIDKTDKWVALALKRVIKMAVDEGYDRVAFVTGEQSAARYDLSKHIDRIHYEKSEDGLYELIAYKIGSRDDSTGSEALHEDEIDLARIEELVGKDIAQKIADEAGEKIGGSYRDWRELKNVDLKVGGEGMKAFYDRIVPSVLKDVLKKVGGGTVGVVELQIPGAQPGSRDVATGAVVGPNGTAGQNLDAPGFDITPAMKKKAANGLPLFSAGVGGTLTKPALRDRLTTGLIGPVVSRLIDAGVIVMHKDVSTLPKSIKAVRGMQAATDGKTVHMVASGLTADTARGALFHEFFHTGGEKLIGTEQWGKLMGRLSSLQKQGQQSSGKAREFFDKARARVQAAEQRGAVTEGFAPEEFGAYAIEEYENAPSTVRKWVDDLIGAVKAWALKRFGKQLGDVTPAQLSAIAKMALMDAAAERMIGRPTMMSARGLTDTPAFKRWFKGSKVVDANGDPLVVYHGTNAEFNVFEKPKENRMADRSRAGFWFTSAQGDATRYGRSTKEVYLSIKKPRRITRRKLDDLSVSYPFPELMQRLKAGGHDGLVVEAIKPDPAMDENGMPEQYVAFDPAQIKSAYGNSGAFDPSNPDIRYSSRSKTDTPAFRRWFGSSEAVNADGSPMVLYHGTGTDIAVFDPNRTTSIDGIFTTPKARYASQVAAGAGGAPNVMPLYASIQNAARMKAADYTAANVRKAMADRAVDGVIVTDADGNVDTVIVKRPEQLKSVFNGGGFDPGSPDVRYSVSPEQAERVIDEASSALDAAPDLIAKDDYIGRVVGDMSLGARLLVHPRTVASVHPEFTPVYMTAISQIETRDANIADLGTGAAAYSKLDEAGKTAVNKALELGRLMSQTYTADQLTAGVTNKGSKTVVSVGDDGKPRTAIVPVEALLSGAGEVVKLSPDEATAYTDLRAMFDRALDKMRDQTLEELGFPELAGLPNAAREISKLALTETGDKAERLQNIAVFVAEIEQAKRAGYVPFARYGDYVVTVKEKIADLTYVEDDAKHLIVQDVPASFAGDLLDMGAEETPEGWRIKKSQKASVERLTEKTVYSTKVETGLRDFFDERKAGKVDDIAPVREAIEKARAEYVGDNPSRRVVAFKAREKTPDAPVVLSDVDALAEVAQIDNATWDAVRDKLADAIKAKGFRRHFFHSDNVPGYTGDFERAIADYVIGMSGYLARRSHMKQWDNSVTAIKDKPKLFEYASKYRDYVNSPQEEFAMVRQVGFFAYIAGVVASAFANLTQVPMLTLPTLSQIAPVPLVMKEVARAYKDTFKMLGRPGKVGLDMFDPDKAPADVRDALKEAWVEGSFVPLETYDLMMTARQRNVGARKGVKLFNDTTKVVALFFTFAERVNRLVTFIAAARLAEKPAVRANANRVLRNDALARREVLANWGQKSLAEWAVDETQYRMGKANRPAMMRGVGSAIMQFKGYMLQTFEAWYRMSKLHGKEGKFAMAASLVTLYALSGLWGMPGADDLRKLIENIYRQIAKKDLDLKTELRQWIAKMSGSNTLAQIVNKGATYPLGVDLTRVGMGSVAPDSPLAAAGIPFDMLIGRPSRAFEKGSSGDPYGAVAELTPNFIKHWIVAGGWAVDGVRDKQGSRILRPQDLSDSDIGMKALGFQPSIITEIRDYEYAQRRQETAVDALKRRYTNQLAKALAAMETESDPKELAKLEERVAEVYADLDAHNETASEEQQIVIGKRALDNRIQREAEGIKSTWGKERKNARGAAEDLRGVFGLSEEDE